MDPQYSNFIDKIFSRTIFEPIMINLSRNNVPSGQSLRYIARSKLKMVNSVKRSARKKLTKSRHKLQKLA